MDEQTEHYEGPKTDYEALVLALKLALTPPPRLAFLEEDKVAQVTDMAEVIAQRLSDDEVHRAMAEVQTHLNRSN